MKTISSNILILTFVLFSCGSASEVTDEIQGNYKFIYPTGQVEIVAIKNDHTYSKTIYSNENDFVNNKQPLYNNNSTWTTKGIELEFENWISFCEFRNPHKIVNEPKSTSMLNVLWFAPTNDRKALLSVFDENGYVFEKVGN